MVPRHVGQDTQGCLLSGKGTKSMANVALPCSGYVQEACFSLSTYALAYRELTRTTTGSVHVHVVFALLHGGGHSIHLNWHSRVCVNTLFSS